jgi:hypothetical protein
MDLLDRLALAGRRYERRRSLVSGSPRLNLSEVLRMYDHKAILDAAVLDPGKQARQMKPDPEKKLKLSLLDLISELQQVGDSYYEVFETAPTGDLSKVRIVAWSGEGEGKGELRILMGRRTLDNYFAEDPVFESVRQATETTGERSDSRV